MISADEARALMPETKTAVDKAMRHAMDCIERHARVGDTQCDATFGNATVVYTLQCELKVLGYLVERLESAPNTLRISW